MLLLLLQLRQLLLGPLTGRRGVPVQQVGVPAGQHGQSTTWWVFQRRECSASVHWSDAALAGWAEKKELQALASNSRPQ